MSEGTVVEQKSEQPEVVTAVPPVEAPPAVSADDGIIDIEQFMKVKLRIGAVLSAELVPKSNKLLKLEVDLGTEIGTRQILSGIAQHYSPAEMVGKRIVVLMNLKPRKVMGLESQGMLLAASNEDASVLSLVEPARDVPIGSVVR